jgi:hypothetical protein
MPAIMGHSLSVRIPLTPGQVTIVTRSLHAGASQSIPMAGRCQRIPIRRSTAPRSVVGTATRSSSRRRLLARHHDCANTPHSDKMRITERVPPHRPGHDVVETTVIDPEALTKPWTTTRTLARHRDGRFGVHLRRKQSQLPRRPGESRCETRPSGPKKEVAMTPIATRSPSLAVAHRC